MISSVDVLRTLWAHKLRAFLTMFGIAWGIVSIVLMVAAGEGLRKGQEEQARNLGKDVMIVFHGRTSLQAGGTHAGRVVHWEDEDVPVVQAESPDCEYAIPELEQDSVRTHSNFNNGALQVTGSYPAFAYIRSLDVGTGRFYDWDDMHESRRVAFLGSDAAKQLFPGRNPVGDTIYLNDFPYTVIGVMAKKKQDSSYDGWDVNKIFVPFAAMRRDFPDKPPGTNTTFDQMLVTPKSVAQHEACKHEVRVALARMHRYDPERQRGVSDLGYGAGGAGLQDHDRWDEVLSGRGGDCDAAAGRHRRDERDAGGGAGADAGDWRAQGDWRSVGNDSAAVFY